MIVREVSNEFDIDRVKDIPWKKEVSDKNAYIPSLSFMPFSWVQKQAHCPCYVSLSQNLSCQLTCPNVRQRRNGAAEHLGCVYLMTYDAGVVPG